MASNTGVSLPTLTRTRRSKCPVQNILDDSSTIRNNNSYSPTIQHHHKLLRCTDDGNNSNKDSTIRQSIICSRSLPELKDSKQWILSHYKQEQEQEQVDEAKEKEAHHDLTNLIVQHPSNLQQVTPDTYVSHIFQYCLGYTPIHRSSLDLLHDLQNKHTRFFPQVSENQMSHYCTDIVEATRNGDLSLIRSLFQSGQCLSCCNSYGESLLHMACRRGYTDIVQFFVEEAKVSPRRTDDGGRTPLHDALWHTDPQFDIVHILVIHEPALLLCKDKRGYAPFTYSRTQHAAQWRQFLWDRKDLLKASLEKRVIITEDYPSCSDDCCDDDENDDDDDGPTRTRMAYKDVIDCFFR